MVKRKFRVSQAALAVVGVLSLSGSARSVRGSVSFGFVGGTPSGKTITTAAGGVSSVEIAYQSFSGYPSVQGQYFAQFSIDTTSGLTVTAPTADPSGGTNIAQPYLFISTLNGGTNLVNGFASGEHIGPGTANTTVIAVTSPTTLESADGSTGMFSYGSTKYVGFDIRPITAGAGDYYGWLSVATSQVAGVLSATFSYTGIDTTANTAVGAGTFTDYPVAAPEPTSLALLGAGTAGLLARRRRRSV